MDKKEKFKMHVKVCERAEKMNINYNDRMTMMMDIEAADDKFNMRLDDWLNADDFNFAHDIVGIRDNIKREKYPETEFRNFVPRFSGN